MKDKCPLLTEFDQMTLGNSTQMIKAILPFMDWRTQQMLSMVIRLKEMMATIDYYKKHASQHFGKGFAADFNQSQLISAISRYCPDINLDLFANMKTFMDMENMMSAMDKASSTANSGAASSDFSFVENMMNPEQKRAYDEFLKNFEDINF